MFYTFRAELSKVWRKSLKIRGRTLRESTLPLGFSQNVNQGTCFLHQGSCCDKQMDSVLGEVVGLSRERGADSFNSLQASNRQLTDWV